MTDQQSYAGRRRPTPLSLLERARARQPEAWQGLMDLYRPLVLYWCGRNGVTADDAEDVAQEVFAAASTGLGNFRRDRPDDTFCGWLRVISRNECFQHLRRERGKTRAAGGDSDELLLAVVDPAPLPDEQEEEAIGQIYPRALELVRGEFEPRTWEMFWLTVVEDRDTADVGAQLGVSAAAVRQAKSRILRRVKEEVGDIT